MNGYELVVDGMLAIAFGIIIWAVWPDFKEMLTFNQ